MLKDKKLSDALNVLSRLCHRSSREAGWWEPPFTLIENPDHPEHAPSHFTGPIVDDQWLNIVTATKLCLIHSEISEAMEGFRKGIPDDHLPDRKMDEVELADALIRIFDLAGAHGMDLGGALLEKFAYNQTREDHTTAHRLGEGGKKF